MASNALPKVTITYSLTDGTETTTTIGVGTLTRLELLHRKTNQDIESVLTTLTGISQLLWLKIHPGKKYDEDDFETWLSTLDNVSVEFEDPTNPSTLTEPQSE